MSQFEAVRSHLPAVISCAKISGRPLAATTSDGSGVPVRATNTAVLRLFYSDPESFSTIRPLSSMRTCIFCGGRPLTKEHVWPAWLSERFGNRPLTIERFAARSEVVRFTTNRLDFRGRVVCARCNNGWMSDMENAVKGIFEAIFEERPFTLGYPGQRAVAAWAMKTAMVMEHTFASGGAAVFYRQNEREALRNEVSLPNNTTVLIGTSAASRFVYAYTVPLQAASIAALSTPVAPANVITFGLGPLVLQVESDRWQEVTGRVGWPWPRPATKYGDWIHPMGRAIEWPLPQPYDDTMLAELAGAFVAPSEFNR